MCKIIVPEIKQNYSYQDSMVLAQKQEYRPMEQDRKPRNKPMHLWAYYLWLRCKDIQWEKIFSSIIGAGKTGELHVKEFNLLTSYIK